MCCPEQGAALLPLSPLRRATAEQILPLPSSAQPRRCALANAGRWWCGLGGNRIAQNGCFRDLKNTCTPSVGSKDPGIPRV